MRILALSISAGTGHAKAAEAIKHYMENTMNDCTVDIVDVLKYIHPMIDKVMIGGYLKAIKSMPNVYGKLYNACENEEIVGNLSRLINEALCQKLGELIELIMPDIIIATHPFHLEMLSPLKKKEKMDIPIVGVITDFAPHSLWACDYVDAYILPCKDLKDEFMQKGVNEDRIYTYGLPVSMQFLKNIDRESVLSDLGFNKKPTVLIMGGGLGLGTIKDVFKLLLQSNLDIQIIAVAGNNTKLKRQIEYLSRESSKKVRVYGYTDMIPEFMSVSDVLISKPGGLTLGEALIKELPIVIISPIPGQEERNADYLLQRGAAIRLDKTKDIVETVGSLLKDQSMIEQLKANERKLSKPDAVINIGNLLTNIYRRRDNVTSQKAGVL